MAMNTFTGINPTSQKFYDKVLLKRLLPKLVWMKHGVKKNIPQKEGDTANYRRYRKLANATTPLQEGVTPTGQALVQENVNAVVKGYGSYVPMTDKLDMMGIDDNVTEATELLGEQAGETLDIVVRDVVAAGTNVFYVGGGVTRVGVAAGNIVDGATMRRIRRIMARNNVEKIAAAGGPAAYIAFIHPDAAYDVMGDAAWVNAKHYADPKAIEEGEIGMLNGVRYIETTLAPVFTGAGVGGLDVYGTVVIGKGGYGVPDVDGSAKPKTIVKQLGSEGSGDPLNQRSSVAWKAYLATVRLEELAILRVEHAVTA